MHENDIGTEIINAAIKIHRELGPGLFESVYEVILSHELKQRGLNIERQVTIPIAYEDIQFDEGFRADIIVENKVIIELKSKEMYSKSDYKQLQTYLKLGNLKLGYLLNFGLALLKDGIVRVVNNLE